MVAHEKNGVSGYSAGIGSGDRITVGRAIANDGVDPERWSNDGIWGGGLGIGVLIVGILLVAHFLAGGGAGTTDSKISTAWGKIAVT